jgi:membrane protein
MPQDGAFSSPIALPRRTWTDTLRRTATGFRRDKLNHWGAALTYYAVLSLFPALLVLVSLVGLFANPERVTRILTATVSQLGPASAAHTFAGPIHSITAHRGTAGVVFVLGVLSGVWAASGYVSAFADASNTIYEVEEGRPFWKLKPLQLAVTLVLILLAALVALALVLSGPVVGALGSALGIGPAALTAWRFAKWPAMIVFLVVIFGTLYYTAPNARLRGVRWVTPGALAALVLWFAASVALALYVSHFGSYDKTYGTLAGAVVFLMWLWITNMAILFGAELNAETERAHRIESGVPHARHRLGVPQREPAGAR